MPTIIVQATTPLTPFAKENLTRLSFDPAKPDTLPEQLFKAKHVTWLGRKVVTRLNNHPNTVGRSLAIYAVIGLIALTIVGIAFIIFIKFEAKKYYHNEPHIEKIQRKLDRKVASINKRAWLIERLGMETFERIPSDKNTLGPMQKGLETSEQISSHNGSEAKKCISESYYISLKLMATTPKATPFEVKLFTAGKSLFLEWGWDTDSLEFRKSKILCYYFNAVRDDFNFAFLREIISGKTVNGYTLAK